MASTIGRLRHGHSKSLTNLYNPSTKGGSTGAENFILSNGVHRNGILRRALVAAREGDLNTLQVGKRLNLIEFLIEIN